MQQLIKDQQSQAILRTFPIQGVANRHIYAYGGNINDQIDIPDAEIDNQNNEYYKQRIKEIGLEAATMEYEEFHGAKPVQEEPVEKPKKKEPLRILKNGKPIQQVEPAKPKKFSVKHYK